VLRRECACEVVGVLNMARKRKVHMQIGVREHVEKGVGRRREEIYSMHGLMGQQWPAVLGTRRKRFD